MIAKFKLFIIISLIFISCKEDEVSVVTYPPIPCETCELEIKQYWWGELMNQVEIDSINEFYQSLGYTNTNAYYDYQFDNSTLGGLPSEVYCDEALDYIKNEEWIDVGSCHVITPCYVVAWEYNE